MDIKELGHVVLSVADLDRSVRFYRDVLGFREVSRLGDRGVMFSGGRTHHELLLFRGQPGASQPERGSLGLQHLALKIGTTDAELRSAKAELDAAGVEIDHITDHGVTHSIYMRDPDGNRVEVFIDVQPELWRQDPSVVGSGGKPLVI